MIDVLMPAAAPRLTRALEFALQGLPHRFLSEGDCLQNRRILFALHTDAGGMDAPTLALLRRLRLEPEALRGSLGAVLLDGDGELYTKQLAQELVFSANGAGCAFPGKPLVEGTGSLYNQHILAQQRGLSLEQTYFARARELAQRLDGFTPPRFPRPRLLVLHSSESGRSSTLWMGREICRKLSDCCEIQEISLQNGTIHDCRGCSYDACLHFAEQNRCFYGGAITEEVLPAVQESDALLLLCPNFNDAVSANITAFFNRLTNLLVLRDLSEKYVFAIVVSGYSGSDLVARQILGAMSMNKGAILPPQFCLMQTANDPGSAQKSEGIAGRLDTFAAHIAQTLLP